MMKRRKLSFAAAVVLFIVFVVNYLVPAPSVQTAAVVTRVIDGDTIVVEGGERVRLLDIDTPERGEKCSTNATNRLEELIDGKEIILISGKEDRDVYDRLLRYVFLNGTFVNQVMVREGWANLYIVNKDARYYDSLVEAEQLAKADGLCVWSD